MSLYYTYKPPKTDMMAEGGDQKEIQELFDNPTWPSKDRIIITLPDSLAKINQDFVIHHYIMVE